MHDKSQKIIQHCNCNNIKVTELREQVISILSEKGVPCGAYDILSALKLKRQNAEPMTVYRTLKFLVSNNLVHRLEAHKKYALCCHPNQEACQIFICKGCSKKYEFHNLEVNALLKSILINSGFELSSKNIEFYGYCKECK